jgi:hypothetical protein
MPKLTPWKKPTYGAEARFGTPTLAQGGGRVSKRAQDDPDKRVEKIM